MNAGANHANLPLLSFMGNGMYLIGAGNFASFELRGLNWGALKPGVSIRFVQDHIENPTSASRCWKVFAHLISTRKCIIVLGKNGPYDVRPRNEF